MAGIFILSSSFDVITPNTRKFFALNRTFSPIRFYLTMKKVFKSISTFTPDLIVTMICQRVSLSTNGLKKMSQELLLSVHSRSLRVFSGLNQLILKGMAERVGVEPTVRD